MAVPALAYDLYSVLEDEACDARIRAAKQATQTIPIVMVTTTDPVAAGFVDSLARPGKNITGLTRLTQELAGKRLEMPVLFKRRHYYTLVLRSRVSELGAGRRRRG